MMAQLIQQELQAPKELPPRTLNEIELQIKQQMMALFKKIPGPIIKIDPKLYHAGRQTWANLGLILAWTEFNQIKVPFAIRIFNDELGPDGTQLRIENCYFWTLSTEGAMAFWKQVTGAPLSKITRSVRKFLGGVKYGRNLCDLSPVSKLRAMQRVHNPALIEFLCALDAIDPVTIPAYAATETKDWFTQDEILTLKSQTQPSFTPAVTSTAQPAKIMLEQLHDFSRKYQKKYHLGGLKLNILAVRDSLLNQKDHQQKASVTKFIKLADDGTSGANSCYLGCDVSLTNKLTLVIIKQGKIVQQTTKQLPSLAWHTFMDLAGYLDHPSDPGIKITN